MADGRPTALNKRAQDVIIDALGNGASMSDSAAAAGIDPATLRRWRRKGESALAKPIKQRNPEERRFARFCLATEHASAEAAIQATRVINGIVDIDLETASVAEQALALKAAQWFLVHRYPEDYSTNPRRETERQKSTSGTDVEGTPSPLELLRALLDA